MVRLNPSAWYPYTDIIKVYSTEDDSLVVWTNPRRIHLHEKTSSGVTVCCESFTAGGIVENPVGTLHFLTSDRFVPADVEPHMDTNDKTCACVGYVQHTSRTLHYTLVAISDAVADREAARQAKILGCVPASMQQIQEFTMHPAMLKDLHRKHSLTLLARTRHNLAIEGHITVLPRKAIDPSCPGSRLILAQFDPSLGYLDEGMWVYARQPSAKMLDSKTNETLAKPASRPYHSETFRYRYNFSHSNRPTYTLRIVGHIVEVRGRDPSGRVEVAIQCSHEILTEISILKDWLDNPDGGNPPPTYFG
ncbi:hypothetical protein F5Y00DRAFT_271100 [Daldinia vernicosa]|uniref:uncharacterized protein n=1 Tax=Daldinia vernicosa TaxID=114800 RepID=UPI00200880EA|nr:uncharacterized protein F5Y00DRAFT_271100 [Daldinia vernicosa]KAI0847575.1 hypothetical protein F5Y00DRAFT_271100 [Daldinia vernicosa]